MTTLTINAANANTILLHLTQELGLMISMAAIALRDVEARAIQPSTMDHLASHIARVTGAMSVTIGVMQLPHPITGMAAESIASLLELLGLEPLMTDAPSTDLPH